MLCYARTFQLRLRADGTRRIDSELILPAGDTIEILDSGKEQRSILMSPNSKDATTVRERLRGDKIDAHVFDFLACTISESAECPSTNYVDAELESATEPPRLFWGHADPSSGDIELKATSKLMEELIRQDGLGRRVYYMEIAVDGLEPTTKANSEGGLVKFIWPASRDRASRIFWPVRGYGLHFHDSPTYQDPSTQEPTVTTLAESQSIWERVTHLLAHARSIERYSLLICWLLAILIAVIIWKR